MSEKKVIIIAGPNGAGKTTFAQQFLPNEASCPIFINADLIASGLSPFQPEKAAIRAGKLMLEEIDLNIRKGNNISFETTLSGKLYAYRIPKWQEMGYYTKLIYLSLPIVEMCIARVASRVLNGGHHIPEDVIRRRFEKGWDNFQKVYKPIVDCWIHYDNSSLTPTFINAGQKQ